MIRVVHRRLPRLAGLFLLLLALCSSVLPVSAAQRGSNLAMQAEDEKTVNWTLNADKVTSLSANEVIEAEGNVVLQRGSEFLKADYARYFAATKWVFLRGNVSASMNRNTMRAEEAEFDLRSRVGWLKNGEIFMDGPHMYFAGQRIDKHWGDVYSFRQAKVTSCDGEVPAWSLEAEEAVVELDGYAQLWRPRFQVKDVPVLASPWMIIPAKRERQTGFLTPEYGYGTGRGFYYNQPFFWAIDESQDLTLNEYFMSKRGLMQGVQYRTRPSVRETGWVRFDWLKDQIRVTNDSDDDVNSSDGLIRNNSDRFWVRGMYEGFLGDPKWKLRADLDFVSDQNMLHEFRSGYSGYEKSRTELFNLFSRDIQEKDLARQSGFMLFRDWDRASVVFSSRYLQDQTLGNGNASRASDTTVQSLPQVDFYLQKGGILDSLPLEIAASAEAGYKYRREGTRGMRYTMTPTLSLPLRSDYGSITATAGIQQTFYSTDTYSKTDGTAKQDGETQTIPTFQADGTSELSRVFTLAPSMQPSEKNVGESRWTAIRHAIQPRLRYRNIPLRDQHDNPYYDSGDRIRPVNELTYSVSNILTRKRDRIIAQKPAKEGEKPIPAVQTSYLEFLRFTLEQSYDIRENGRTDQRVEYERRPFRDLIADLHLQFDEFIGLSSRTQWSPYTKDITRHDHGATIRYAPWGSAYVGLGFRDRVDEYLYKRDRRIKTLDLRGDVNLYGPLAVGISYSRDYERNEDVERSIHFTYSHQCFQIMGFFFKDGFEERYGMRITLLGLGD